jgi:hypothetical protein
MARTVLEEKGRRSRVMCSGSVSDHWMCCVREMADTATVQSCIRSLLLAASRCKTVEVMRPYWHVPFSSHFG